MNLGEPSVQLALSAMISLPVGIISGIYSGIIVTRMARFTELRNAIRRTILNIDFMNDGEDVNIVARKQVSEIAFAASDLFFLGHRNAGEVASGLSADIEQTIASAPKNLAISQIEKKFAEWQHKCRAMKPDKGVIFSLATRL